MKYFICTALLLLSGCAANESITCTFANFHISCDRSDMSQDSPSPTVGAEDEKPVRTFLQPLS